MKDILIEKLYEISSKPYAKYCKRNLPWSINKDQMLQMDQESLGFKLGYFLVKNGFEIQPKLEDHDVFHVLTKTGTSVYEEIGMQFYLLGNGKRSLYLFLVIITGILFYPAKFKYFNQQYLRGKQSFPIHNVAFLELLEKPLDMVRNDFNIK
ncbi:hypothetical protein GV828_02715 [Flavobacterium sp. NST-5]|uniref:Coenzyme Q (Ubiquinone) biosynthesis protein Coq4 n=1 Tax=Flavobacterium ichthyis TaxID=2698827 RepID=A0ABW9ZBD5_9FLAO|nr:Coq4 family protein [Flavobacterium ichthyis]NBL64108.1 hypothetical protein [Flavobacterium ichthyis]